MEVRNHKVGMAEMHTHGRSQHDVVSVVLLIGMAAAMLFFTFFSALMAALNH